MRRLQTMKHRMFALVLAAGLAWPLHPALAQDFQGQAASVDAVQVARWAVQSGDPAGLPFAIVDKVQSRVFVFDAQGLLRGTAPALVGLAAGDVSVPGIGQRKLSTIRPDERTTPAGRFAATVGRSLQGDEILWVDYESAVALHRVIAVPRERRLERLASLRPQERRITYGCINVAASFFDAIVAPTFRATGGIVYVLPETGPASALFGAREPPTAPPAQ